MYDYIDRQEVIKKLNELDSRLMRGHYADECAGVTMANSIVQNVPTADVAPVVHGRWVYNSNGMDWNLGAWQCSVCKCNNNNLPGNDKYNPYIFQGSNYCPNCGAKMDEEEYNDNV